MVEQEKNTSVQLRIRSLRIDVKFHLIFTFNFIRIQSFFPIVAHYLNFICIGF